MKKRIYLGLFTFLLFFMFTKINEEEVFAAPKGYMTIHGKKKALTGKSVTAYVGGKEVRLAYRIDGKTKGIKGRWTSSNPKVIKVGKDGSCKAVGNGSSNVYFWFKSGKKKYRLSCKVKARTRAEEVELTEVEEGSDSITMKQNAIASFEAKLIPSEEALEVNPKIKSTDKVFYHLYGNEECTVPTELGEVNEKGEVKSRGVGGTMYLRAEARPGANSKSVVYSNVAAIEVEGLTKEEALKEEEEKKKQEAEKAEKNKLRPARIEISKNAPLDAKTPSSVPSNGLFEASASFKVFDGNGKDITFATGTAIQAFSVSFKWNEQEIHPSLNFPGKIPLALVNADKVQVINGKLIKTPQQPFYYPGELTVSYKEAGYPDVTATAKVSFVPHGVVMRAEVKGIYKKTAVSGDYVPVIAEDRIDLKQGEKIESSGGHVVLNYIPNSYYLLIDATDSYGNKVANMGVTDTEIGLVVKGSAGIALDSVSGLMENTKKIQSIAPIIIDGIPYLTYPLKPVQVGEGDLEIITRGQPLGYKKVISDGSSLATFFFTGTTQDGKNVIVGRENIMEYYLYTTTGKNIKKYEQVLTFLELTDIGNTGNLILPPDSKAISSAKGSIFRIRKNANGEAEIIYMPQTNVLTFNPGIPGQPFLPGNDDITLLKGFGEKLERKVQILVHNR